LGHYPQDQSVLDACDALGLLVIEPIPGWQFFNDNELFIERTYRDIRDIIRQDRNHPSIIIWETILNESWPPVWWKDNAQKVAHEEFPEGQFFTGGDMYGYYGWDVLYNDWHEDITRPNKSEKPGFIREYGDYEFGGHYSTTRKSRKDGEQGLLQNAWNFQWSHNKYRKQYPWTMGDANWSMFDYNRGCCDNICYSGISELNRIPKFSYYFFRSQIDIGSPLPGAQMNPMLYIANYWTPRDTSKVVVYGNVEEVELLINGKFIARHKPDAGSDTDYEIGEANRNNGGTPFNGGNSGALKHPPFTFHNVEWDAGELKAIGYVKGKQVVQKVVRTPEEPGAIKLVIEESGKQLTEKDVFFVYAKIIDKHGTLCVDDLTEITLQVEGDGVLVSPATILPEGGIATFLLRTNSTMTEISFNATSVNDNLHAAHLKIVR
jgi:beta-galactosidase